MSVILHQLHNPTATPPKWLSLIALGVEIAP